MDPTQTYKNGDPPGDGVILFHRPRPCQNETKRLAHHTPTHVTLKKNKDDVQSVDRVISLSATCFGRETTRQCA